MNRGNGPILAIVACALLAVVVFFLVDFSAGKTFATPQEVIDAVRAASQRDDMRAWCQCITEESRDLLAASVVVDEFAMRKIKGQTGKDKEKAHFKAVAGVFKDHGISDEHLEKLDQEMLIIRQKQMPTEAKVKAAQSILAPVKDRDGFIKDLFETIQKISGSESPLSLWKNAKLLEVQISGKTAQGLVSVGRGQPQPFTFKKQGDGWRLDLFGEDQDPDMGPGGFNPHGGMPPGHP